MLHASLSAGRDFSDSSVDTEVIFFDFALHNKIVRGVASDTLCCLRKEEHERAKVIRRWRANACYGSIRGDGHIYRLTSNAVNEIVRLRLKLKEAGIDYEPPSA
jgi:hypothetical protein